MIAIVTAYCHCLACNGVAEGFTASDVMPVAGITVAAPKSVSFGTRVRITLKDGRTWTLTAQDRTHGRYDGRWDIFMASHAEARAFGIHSARIEILGGGAGSGGSIPRAASSNAYSQRSPTALILPAKPQGKVANGARTQRRAVIPRPNPGNAPASFGTKRK